MSAGGGLLSQPRDLVFERNLWNDESLRFHGPDQKSYVSFTP
jgi:hypothetical protein